MIDVEKIRKDFPILDQIVNDEPLVYLDNAATTQKPKAVLEAVNRYYQEDNANVHRGVHTLAERATASYEAARETVRSFYKCFLNQRGLVYERNHDRLELGWSVCRRNPRRGG